MSSKKKSFNIRIDEATRKLMEEAAEELNISLAEWTRNTINSALENRGESILDYDFSLDVCPVLGYLEEDEAPTGKQYGEGYYCFFKVPIVKKLGSGLKSVAKKYCEKCTIREKYFKDKKDILLVKKEVMNIDIPSCYYGGQIKQDKNKISIYCKNPKMSSEWRDVHKWCKTLRKGANCEYLKWSKITMKGELKEQDHR